MQKTQKTNLQSKTNSQKFFKKTKTKQIIPT